MRGGKVIPFPAKASRRKSKKSAATAESKMPELTRAAVFSFLKDTRGLVSWTAADLARTLGINLAQANSAIPLLAMQGYIKRTADGDWLTTIAGEKMSGSVAPRFRKMRVEHALKELTGRIRAMNADRKGPGRVTKTVAFGDFLEDEARVQAADVGIEFTPRDSKNGNSGQRRRALQSILRTLKAKSPMLHPLPFEDWMTQRTRRKLL